MCAGFQISRIKVELVRRGAIGFLNLAIQRPDNIGDRRLDTGYIGRHQTALGQGFAQRQTVYRNGGGQSHDFKTDGEFRATLVKGITADDGQRMRAGC